MAMITGTYQVRLNKNCAFRLPKKIYQELLYGSTHKKVLFAAASYLRCYPQDGLGAYTKDIHESDKKRYSAYIRYTAAYGSARVSFWGMLCIPDALCELYGYKPKMRITLLGCGDYIEIRPGDI